MANKVIKTNGKGAVVGEPTTYTLYFKPNKTLAPITTGGTAGTPAVPAEPKKAKLLRFVEGGGSNTYTTGFKLTIDGADYRTPGTWVDGDINAYLSANNTRVQILQVLNGQANRSIIGGQWIEVNVPATAVEGVLEAGAYRAHTSDIYAYEVGTTLPTTPTATIQWTHTTTNTPVRKASDEFAFPDTAKPEQPAVPGEAGKTEYPGIFLRDISGYVKESIDATTPIPRFVKASDFSKDVSVFEFPLTTESLQFSAIKQGDAEVKLYTDAGFVGDLTIPSTGIVQLSSIPKLAQIIDAQTDLSQVPSQAFRDGTIGITEGGDEVREFGNVSLGVHRGLIKLGGATDSAPSIRANGDSIEFLKSDGTAVPIGSGGTSAGGGSVEFYNNATSLGVRADANNYLEFAKVNGNIAVKIGGVWQGSPTLKVALADFTNVSGGTLDRLLTWNAGGYFQLNRAQTLAINKTLGNAIVSQKQLGEQFYTKSEIDAKGFVKTFTTYTGNLSQAAWDAAYDALTNGRAVFFCSADNSAGADRVVLNIIATVNGTGLVVHNGGSAFTISVNAAIANPNLKITQLKVQTT